MHYSTHLLRHVRYSIGQNLRAARGSKKMTLRYLSRKSGVPEGKIDQFELGKNEIALDELLKLACVLDVGLDALLGSLDSAIAWR